MTIVVNGITTVTPCRNTAISLTLDVNDFRINVTDTSAARTITIPSGVVATRGKTYEVVDTSGAAGLVNVIIDTAGAEKVNGQDSITGITANYGQCKIVSDGTNWTATEF